MKLIEMAQDNLNESADLARELSAVKSPTGFFEMWSAHARRRYEKWSTQFEHLVQLAQKAVMDLQYFPIQAAKAASEPFRWGR